MRINFNPVTYKPAFTSLVRVDMEHDNAIDSAFFRDSDTLTSAIETLRNNFPQGAQILNYAASNGEEALSIAMLLGKDKRKFPIRALDISSDAKELYNKGVYSVFPNYHDSFLLRKEKKSGKQAELTKMFYQNMVGTKRPAENINESPVYYKILAPFIGESQISYFSPKKDIKSTIEYKIGDIRDINKEVSRKEIGAIFFRNAFYHLLDNMDGDILRENDFKEYEKKSTKTTEERQKITDEIIDKIYDKLALNGVFVLGVSPNEVVFVAPDYTPENEVIRYCDTIQYQKAMQSLSREYVMNSLSNLVRKQEVLNDLKEEMDDYNENAGIKIYKKSLMQRALERDGRFEPVCYSAPQIPLYEGQEVPTVWVKVK